MQIVATKSPLGWKTVNCMEGRISLPEGISVDSDEVKKAEKECMSHERDLRAATNAKRKRGEDYSYQHKRGSYSYRGRGRGGAASGRERACFRCGDNSHMIAQCPKGKENGEK